MSRPELEFADNGAGWQLALRRVAPPPGEESRHRPVLIVPGYGMNSFIFGFHPNGLSLEAYLASRGLEVWSADLRAQGRSVFRGPGSPDLRISMADLAVEDVGAAIGHVLAHTRTGKRELDLVGCSLGASLVFAHLAFLPDAPVHSVVSLGGLVTWKKVPKLVLAAFASPWLAGALHFKKTRALAGHALPLLARWAPGLLSIYMHGSSTDTTQAARMVQTVEDPIPSINREIAEWVRARELSLRGVNVSRAIAAMRYPLLCVVAMQDGIVPPETARGAYDDIGSADKELLLVGDAGFPIAHADLFLCTGAEARVFAPIANFLLAR